MVEKAEDERRAKALAEAKAAADAQKKLTSSSRK